MKFRIKQKWGMLFLVVLTTIYIVLFYYLNESAEEIKEIYFADRMTAAHKVLIDRYNEINEGKVKIIPIDFPNYDFSTNERKELLARSLRGKGDGIDLFAVDVIWVQRFAKWAEPLDIYFSSEEKKRILNSALQSCYFDGELFAVPLERVQGVMYYREDLIKQLPNGERIIELLENDITWEQFIKLKNDIKSKHPFYIFPADDYEGLICSFVELLLSLDPDYFETVGFDFNTPEAEKSLQLLVDLVNKYKLTPPVVTEFTEIPSYQYYINNDALFIRGWQSYDKDFDEEPIDSVKEQNLRKVAIPHFKNGDATSVLGGWNLMVSKFSDKKDEVIDFVKFLISDEAQEIFYEESGYFPVIERFYEDENYSEKYPELTETKELIETSVNRPSHESYTRYSEIMSHNFELAIKNELSVKEALQFSTNSIQFNKVLLKDIK